MSLQPKKRLIVDVTPEEHESLMERAASRGLSLSNMVRKALKISSQQHGKRVDLEVKRAKQNA